MTCTPCQSTKRQYIMTYWAGHYTVPLLHRVMLESALFSNTTSEEHLSYSILCRMLSPANKCMSYLMYRLSMLKKDI